MRHAQFCDEHRRQDADVDLLANADRDRAAVLHTGFFQRYFVQFLNDEGVIGVTAHGLDLRLVLIDGDDLFAGGGQCFHQRRAEPA